MTKRITAVLRRATEPLTTPTLTVMAGLTMVWYGVAQVSAAAAWVAVGATLVFLAVPLARFVR